mgnify:CR=1 FL=1
MTQTQRLDEFQDMLEQGLLKVCAMSGFDIDTMMSPDIEARWDSLLKDYMADAVENINGYPHSAIGFAAYLGMAVAHQWDSDWARYKDKSYRSYCGERGFDDMDDHIADDLLHLEEGYKARLSKAVLNCAQATLDLMRHEGIETGTEYGFYILVRCCTALYRTGVALELTRLGYKKQFIDTSSLS